MGKHFDKKIFKGVLFLIIGIFLMVILQLIFMPKRVPFDKTNDAGKMRYYLGEEKNSIDVLIFGTSHPSRGILPMEMYEAYGIKSYNLATSVQPIEATYYTLREALKNQKPKVIIWDVSNLYIDYADSSRWKMAMDEMPVGKNKELLVKEYLKKFNDDYNQWGGESPVDLLFPLMEYHTRWKELTKEDFNILKNNRHYFAKGGQVNSMIFKGISVDDMNSMANELVQNIQRDVYEYNDEGYREFHEEDILYQAEVPETNIEWLLKIKKLCDDNEMHFLAVKIPSSDFPQLYPSAWTMEKYNKTCMLCGEYGIRYYDFLYDADMHFDYEKDSCDSGAHLNLYGARKVSLELGGYLKEHYGLSGEHNEQWDRDFISYQKVREVALLELEQDFPAYVNMLADEYKDKMIFIAASDDMSQGLNEEDINALKALGLQMDYLNALRNSYIAVIENGEVRYEALSNRALNYSGLCSKSDKRYEISSMGWWAGLSASIKLDGNEYAVNSRGLNIVVYDDERGLVLDSVCFDTCTEYHTPVRNNEMINRLEEEFERYIMEVEDR